MDNNNINIAKVIDYNSENNPNKIYKLVLIGNADMYNNLKDNQINQFFFDCTYKLVLPNKHRFRLMVLCCYNSNIKKTKLYLFVLLPNEKEETFKTLFSYLKENCSFNPRNIMCYFL